MFYLYEISVWVFSLVMAVQGGICTVFLNNALLFFKLQKYIFLAVSAMSILGICCFG